MANRLSTAQRNTLADAYGDSLNSGSFKVYTGTQPTSADDTATGTLLVTFTLPADAMSAAASGACSLSAAVNGTAVAAGTAGWGRFLKTDGTTVVNDVAVSESGGGGEAIISNATIAVDDALQLTSYTWTQPAS